MTEYADWLEYKAMRDRPGVAPCPFCGIRHDPGKTFPYCTMATHFRWWRDAGKPRYVRVLIDDLDKP